jgi:hypothetical protein
MNAILTPREVVELSAGNQLDESLINDYDIKNAQIKHLKPLFTDDNWDLLVADVNNFSLSIDEINSCVAWWTLYDCLPRLHLKIVNAGILSYQVQGASIPGAKSIDNLFEEVKNRALDADNELMESLLDNYSQGDMRKTKIIGSIIIPNSDYEANEEEED